VISFRGGSPGFDSRKGQGLFATACKPLWNEDAIFRKTRNSRYKSQRLFHIAHTSTNLRWLVAGFPLGRPGFKPGSGHVGCCDRQKWRWGRFSPRTSISPANLHSICFSTIIFITTRGWHNRPGVAAVPIASQTK
jgi:hypothetical protein